MPVPSSLIPRVLCRLQRRLRSQPLDIARPLVMLVRLSQLLRLQGSILVARFLILRHLLRLQ